NGAGFLEISELKVDVVHRFLQCEYAELVFLHLGFIDLRGWEIGDAEGGEARCQPGNVRNLISVCRRAADEAQSRGGIDDGRDIGKASLLAGAIMDGIEQRNCILDSQGIFQKPAGEEILRAPGLAAVLDVVIAGPPAASVKADLPAVVEGRGLDVDDAYRSQAVLCRQRPGDERQAADEAGIQEWAKSVEAIGQQDAVDAERRIIYVFVANMQTSFFRRILRNAGELQQHILDRGIAALRHRLDSLAAPGGGRRTDRREDIVAPLIEGLGWRRGRGVRSGR